MLKFILRQNMIKFLILSSHLGESFEITKYWRAQKYLRLR